jgi:hypothetical protein
MTSSQTGLVRSDMARGKKVGNRPGPGMPQGSKQVTGGDGLIGSEPPRAPSFGLAAR